MLAKGFHSEVAADRNVSLRDVIDELRKKGFEPLIRPARDSVVERLGALNLPFSSRTFGLDNDTEIVYCELGAILLKVSDLSEGSKEKRLFDAAAVSADPKPLESVLTTLSVAQFSPLTFHEIVKVAELRQKLGELSPNGKLLADPLRRCPDSC